MSHILLPPALRPLPLGAIRPAGWLRRQLAIQAAGLSGHLDQIWPDVADSAWIGGAAEGWERGPYWLDGFIPLAVLLDDPELLRRAHHWVETILARQHADGWLGPLHDSSDPRRRAYDPWPVFVALKALAQYQEATGEPRIIPAMLRFLRCLATLIERQPLFDWARFRWADLAVTLCWLYERTGEPWLLELARATYAQSFDWQAHFERFPYREKLTPAQIYPAEPPPGVTFRLDMASHVVNNAMALKQPALWWRISHDPTARVAPARMIAALDRYHGQASGLFSGDEHLAGRSPSQGTELCAVVELMFSLECLIAILGDPAMADRLEQLAWNALPATFSPDMWTHQYVQQANQVRCAHAPERVYTNNGPDANCFGLEPNYGCCTANMHQGWPKFAAHLWMATPDGGLAAVAYAPCALVAPVGAQSVCVTVTTDYPFDERVELTVACDEPADFPLLLRIPAWASGATVALAGEEARPAAPGTFHRIARTWVGREQLTLRLPMAPRLRQGFNGSVTVERGPLVYALPVGEEWRPVPPRTRSGPTSDPRVAHDFEVHPTTPWAYGLLLDPARPEAHLRFERRPLGPLPFSPDGAPVVARVRGRAVPGWQIERGAAAPPPAAPVATGPEVDLTLIPYGCTNLRVTELPLVSATANTGGAAMLFAHAAAPGGQTLDAETIAATLHHGLAGRLSGARVLVLIPDHTRTLPLPHLFRLLVEELHDARELNFMVALGTHPPLSEPELCRLVGISAEERAGRYRHVGLWNHQWDSPEALVQLGVLPRERIQALAGPLWHPSLGGDVPVRINRAALEADQILIVGPTFPHEVIGFSGGAKYLFPGISGPELIHVTHWLGALAGVPAIIGFADTPVRDVVHAAAELLPTPITLVSMVVVGTGLAGLYVGEHREAWRAAAELSAERHIRWLERPVQQVLSWAAPMYDELWTAAKAMYKLEPVIADGGELILYAPHLATVSHVHGRYLYEVGYHVRDYFLGQWERFAHVPLGVLAHSTHLRGAGTFVAGVERPRIRVTLATQLPPEDCERLALGYLDPATIDPVAWQGREDEGLLFVPKAGEILYRLRP